jgi:hypothetical protein
MVFPVTPEIFNRVGLGRLAGQLLGQKPSALGGDRTRGPGVHGVSRWAQMSSRPPGNDAPGDPGNSTLGECG